MSSEAYSEGVTVARDYYDSAEADAFYGSIWGGEDIHVGLYDGTDDIRAASRRTVERMAQKAAPLAGKRVIDLGSGYGGAARVLAGEHGAHVTCLNLSRVENERNRRLTAEAGLSGKIEVIDGSFDAMPFAEGSFDLAWSQDAILHAPDRLAVLDEVARVLRPEGTFVFTDPMQADGLADTAALQPIYDRIHLDSLGSPGFYRKTLGDLGMTEMHFDEHPEQLARHYSRVREVLVENADDLREKGVSADYIERMKSGLTHWIDGGLKGFLTWGIFVFEKGRGG